MMGYRVKRNKNQEQFWDAFLELREDPLVQQLKQYPNHKISNLYDHSSRVAVCAYDLSRRLHICINGKSLAKGAMLHDYYLYHARSNKEISARDHWLGHPRTAFANAEKVFYLTELEKNIILSHMWPLNFCHFPKSREAVLVSAADKICACGELILKRNYVKKIKRKEKSR